MPFLHAWMETEIAKWQIQNKQKTIYNSSNSKYEHLKSLNVNLIYVMTRLLKSEIMHKNQFI